MTTSLKVTATLEAIAQDELVGLAVLVLEWATVLVLLIEATVLVLLREATVLVLLGRTTVLVLFTGVTGSARIFSEACSATVTIRAEGLVVGIPGKMLASTTKILSVP